MANGTAMTQDVIDNVDQRVHYRGRVIGQHMDANGWMWYRMASEAQVTNRSKSYLFEMLGFAPATSRFPSTFLFK